MNSSDTSLKALPADPTPDSGPLHRAGIVSFVLVLSSAILALGLCVALYRDGQTALSALCLSLVLVIVLLSVRFLKVRLQHRGTSARSHSLLVDHLGFRIDFTCQDVAMTAFLSPDNLEAGASAKLLCFLENYASRQRLAEFVIGPHPKLGIPEPLKLKLHLAAGQAAVYVHPLQLSQDLLPGDHDLPIELQVRRPAGTGLLLPGARRHLHNLWTVHFAAPFTVTAAKTQAATAPVSPRTEEACYLSLASVSEKEPRLAALESQLS